MPPKRASRANKRKTDGPSSTQKRVRDTKQHNNNLTEKVVGHPPSSLPHNITLLVEKESADNAPVSSRTRSRCKKRTLADDDIETPANHTQYPKPAKRRRTSNPTKRGVIEDVAQHTKALLLPVELHSLILEAFWEEDDLGDDELFTVYACISACKVWRAAARPHLFRSIKIRSPASLERLTSLIQADASIPSYIRKVLLLGSGRDCKDEWMYAFPSVLETTLPSLKTLELYRVTLSKPQKKDIRAYCDWIYTLSTLTSVHQLYLGVVFMSPNALTALVRAFPRLTKVWMEQSTPGQTKDRAPIIDHSIHATDVSRSSLADNRPLAYPILYPPPPIRSFQVDNYTFPSRFNFDHLKGWFVPEAVSSSLTTFNLMPLVHIVSAARIITAASPVLSFLQIPTQGTSVSQFEAALDLSKLEKLRTFRIYCCKIGANANEMTTAHHLISALDAPNLEILSLIICYDVSKNDDFHPIDQHLEKFTRLQEVHVEYFADSPEPLDVRRKYIERNFPLTVKRGLLQVKEVDLKYLPYHPPNMYNTA